MAPAAIARAIEALLAATPEPPALDADPAVVTELAERMLREREPLCRALAELQHEGAAVPASQAAAYASLLARNERWTACLSHGRHTIRERLYGSRRPRAAYPQP